MIAFVKEVEGLSERGQLERLRGEEGEWGMDVGGRRRRREGVLASLTPPSSPRSPGDATGAGLCHHLEGLGGDP